MMRYLTWIILCALLCVGCAESEQEPADYDAANIQQPAESEQDPSQSTDSQQTESQPETSSEVGGQDVIEEPASDLPSES